MQYYMYFWVFTQSKPFMAMRLRYREKMICHFVFQTHAEQRTNFIKCKINKI
jgi:hypothetical protein